MKHLFSELTRRHVPHVAGLYLAALWGTVEFVDWTVEEFVLSPHLPGFVFLLGLSLTPSIAALAWRLSDPGGDRTSRRSRGPSFDFTSAGRVEAGGILLNVAAAASVLYVSYGDKGLGSATRQVRFVDEAGDSVSVQVPRQEYVKSVLLFHFDHESASEELDRMSYGVTVGLQTDLLQNPFVMPSSQFSSWYGFQEDLTEAGFETGLGVPLALKRQLAAKAHIDHFLAGSIHAGEAGTSIHSRLYRTQTGKLLADHTFRGDSLLALLDEVSSRLLRDLGVPDYDLEVVDLPVAEVTTGFPLALEYAGAAGHAFANSDWAANLASLERAVQIDSTFALARWELAYAYLHAGQRTQADSMVSGTVPYLYRLPESDRLIFNALRYRDFEGDIERALRTAEYAIELHPYDVGLRYLLLELRLGTGDRDAIVDAARRVLEINPNEVMLYLSIGQEMEWGGDRQGAIDSYLRYAEEAPHDPRGCTYAASVYADLGMPEKAREMYDRAEIAAPDETWVLLARARFELNFGDLERARELRDRALAAGEDVDRFDQGYFQLRGQYRKAREAFLERLSTEDDNTTLNRAIVFGKSSFIADAARGGLAPWALGLLDSLSSTMPPPYDGLLARSYMNLYLDLGDTVRAREQVGRADSVQSKAGIGTERIAAAHGKGRLAELAGECARALEHYRNALDILADYPRTLLGKARCERELGQLEAAEATLQRLLAGAPADPEALFLLATVYERVGRTPEALDALDRVLEIWKPADPEFGPAQRARALRRELVGRMPRL